MKIVEDFIPLFIVVIFALGFGFNEYFKTNGMTFRQGVHHLFHPHDAHHAP